MRIEKLEVRGFGKLTGLSLEFDRGLNIIYGNNESGKTSLQWFIKSMFFGLKGGRTSKDGVLPPLKRYKPWNGNDFGGSLEYRLDSGEFFRVGRNFNTNSVKVFDAYFNDITGSFEESREKGAQFADKHLGLNEVCFDKTVFIRQMESRIGEDGTGELLNRLINVSQTGFEDISFNRAKEALKEALKKHVGTDKTTTKPLDKINARLDELQALKLEISKKRDSLFEVESELKELINRRDALSKSRANLGGLKETVIISETVSKNKKIKKELDCIIRSIEADEAALQSAEKKLNDIEGEKEQLYKFSSFSTDDIDRVDFEYSKLMGLLEDNCRIEHEAAKKRNELSSIEHQLESLKAFNYMDENVEYKVLELNKDIENLKKDYDRSNQEVLNEKINNVRKRERGYVYKAAGSVIFSAVLTVIGITGVYVGYVAAAAALIAVFAFVAMKRKETGVLTELLNEKKLGFINANSIKEEIGKRQKTLEEIYKAVDAAGIEEFLKLRASYDSMVRQASALNDDIEKLESDQESNRNKVEALKPSIIKTLREAGIADNTAAEITDDMVKKFKYGVRNYKELEPGIIYSKQRIKDLYESLQKYYRNACSISGMPCGSKAELEGIVEHLCRETAVFEEQLKNYMISVDVLAIDDCLRKELFSSADSSFSNIFTDKAESMLSAEMERINEDIKGVLLRIRECETLLKSAGDDDELQRIIEETSELSEKKTELEDINTSLKTALEVLTEASAELQKDFMPALNAKMSSILDRISFGRYKDVRADDNLMLRVITPETGDIVAALTLSGGTIDQIYLALRVAMAGLISSTNENLLFIMDEVLAQYDDERTRETLKFLYELSEERQVILFTCKGREVDIAREVCGEGINIIKLV